ncbi:8-oxo-dGTP pyrophosphatase MutT (NUDIX family) [Streptacidiphilus sp. MAP12-33]|uniref:NUDIX domain-containing protein n=1 Tax=Streptacidiphilus sp. MAP12-33 TaxID=3156266 RepID=UPI00351550E7
MSANTSPAESKMAHPRMAAGALFFDPEGRVLMVQPSYKDYWEIPGGYIETGESPLRACEREVWEELRITPRIGALLAVDWAPSESEGDKVLYIFDGGELGSDELDRIQLQPEELITFRFVEPGRAGELTIPRLARRIAAAAAARQAGETVYLEHGQVPGSIAA